MTVYSAPTPQMAPRPATGWWYTLAHEETQPAALGVAAVELVEFAEALSADGQSAPAALVARIAREVACQRLSGQPEGERYVWAFRSLGDALAAVRANHRSDYHPYPHPQSVREASLDRLYQRFPLSDYPRTVALLFSGMRVCGDPRLGADPHADSLAALAPDVIIPKDWHHFTLCGFQRGVALVRVSASSRWLRIPARTLEDVWATARQSAEAPTAQRNMSALKTAESLARDALLRATPASAEAFQRIDASASAEAFSQRAEAVNAAPGRRTLRSARQAAGELGA